MTTNAQRAYSEFGQSIWYDNVQRGLLQSGQFAALVQAGVRGCTSNPTIFDKAIGGSSDYDAALRELVARGCSVDEIYHELVCEDIRTAADVLRPVYEQSEFRDGYISLEVQPKHAFDTRGTIDEALELRRRIDRPNLMIKVPATREGLTAITELTAQGVCVNVTLIFSRQRYIEVAEAYLAGLERAASSNTDVSRITSVASFFVSRIDSKVDAWLESQPSAPSELLGKAAIANAKLAYVEYGRLFGGERFETLRRHGAQTQRLLWASTSTKNPSYPDTLYVDELIGRDTVNTVPPATLEAFQDHGKLAATLEQDVAGASRTLERLAGTGLSLDSVCEQLLAEGVDAFVASMKSLYEVIAARRDDLAGAGR